MTDLKIGDRVEIITAPTAPHGTVEYVDREYVRVRWDDDQIGLLYYNDRMIPNARYLVKLAPKAAP